MKIDRIYAQIKTKICIYDVSLFNHEKRLTIMSILEGKLGNLAACMPRWWQTSLFLFIVDNNNMQKRGNGLFCDIFSSCSIFHYSSTFCLFFHSKLHSTLHNKFSYHSLDKSLINLSIFTRSSSSSSSSSSSFSLSLSALFISSSSSSSSSSL